jgi:hypothetical protein
MARLERQDVLSEVLFGLITVLTFTLGASVAAGDDAAPTLVLGAIVLPEDRLAIIGLSLAQGRDAMRFVQGGATDDGGGLREAVLVPDSTNEIADAIGPSAVSRQTPSTCIRRSTQESVHATARR